MKQPIPGLGPQRVPPTTKQLLAGGPIMDPEAVLAWMRAKGPERSGAEITFSVAMMVDRNIELIEERGSFDSRLAKMIPWLSIWYQLVTHLNAGGSPFKLGRKLEDRIFFSRNDRASGWA